MPSTKFIAIQEKVKQYTLLFLNFPSSDSLVESNQDKIRAYLVLACAEIEWYLEKSAIEIERLIYDPITVNGILPMAKIEMFAFMKSPFEATKEYDFQKRSTKLRKAFSELIVGNHGAKDRHILTMFLPLGIDYSTIPTGLVQTLNSISEKRDEIAHRSISPRVTLALDRDIVHTEFEQLLSLIENFDRVLIGFGLI